MEEYVFWELGHAIINLDNSIIYPQAAMLRHSKFNPRLLRKRIAESEGDYVSAQKTDKL